MKLTTQKYEYVSDRYGPDPFTCTERDFLAMVAQLVHDHPTDWTMPALREAPDGSLRELVPTAQPETQP